MNELDLIKQKIEKLVGSPLPQFREESMQDKVVDINRPQKATKQDYERKNPANVVIDSSQMIGKGMDTTGAEYAEGLEEFQSYPDMNVGRAKLGTKQPPIISKAGFAPHSPNQLNGDESEVIEGEKNPDVLKKMLIPVKIIVHHKDGTIKTAIRWKTPESIGVKKIESKSSLDGVITVSECPYFVLNSKVKQTMYYLADSIEIEQLHSNNLLPLSENKIYGQGIYLYSDLDKAKEDNVEETEKTILPVKVNVNNAYSITDQSEFNVDLKDNLKNLGYDCIYLPSDEAKIFNLVILDNTLVRVIGQFEDDKIKKSEDSDYTVDEETLKLLKCDPAEDDEDTEEEYLNKSFFVKSVIQTLVGSDGRVDYKSVPNGASIWVTVHNGGPLDGRHILITKRPDGLFSLTGGSGFNQIKDKYGVSTPTAALRHLVVGGTPQKGTAEKEIDVKAAEEKKENAPLLEKKKELVSEANKAADSAWKDFQESIGVDEKIGLSKLKTQREDLIKQATGAGLSEDEAVAYSTSIIRHASAINRQITDLRTRETGLKELQVYNKLRAMTDASPEDVQQELSNLSDSLGDFRGGLKLEVPSAAEFKGLTQEEIDSKTGNYLDEKVSQIINPNPTDFTLVDELKAEGSLPEGEPPQVKTLEVIPEVKPLEIKNMDALKASVDRFKEFHNKQNEVNAVKKLLKPKTFDQVTPELLEQLALEVKAIAPQATDSDIEEIERSYEEAYTQNNSALSFYSALGDFWNDKNALTKTENKFDNGFGQYVSSGATGAIAALSGKFFGKRFEAEKLIEKTNVETAALVAAFKLRDEYRTNLTKYNNIIQQISDSNATNQTKTEKTALDRHKVLQQRYQSIQTEKAKGTLSSDAFLLDAQTSNLIEQKNNLGTALGSMQASAAFLEALIVARDSKDRKVSIDFGEDHEGAEMRLNELGLGDKAQVDISDPKHVRLVTGVGALQRFENGQEVVSQNYDKNEKLKNNTDNTFTDSEGNNYVNKGAYSVPFWKDKIEINGKEQDHYFRVEQRNDIEWLKNQGGGVLSHPTGTGKTNATLGFFANKINDDKNYSALTVVPKGHVKQWIDEAHKFTDLQMVEIPEGLNIDKRREILAKMKPGQIAVISHGDAVRSYYDIQGAHDNGLFKGMAIDEPQELASKSVKGNMSASVRKLTQLDVENRIALTATPARDNLVEAYDLVNWASHHDKSLGARSRFQKVYGGYGSGTNAQDVTLQQMIQHEIAPFISGNRLTNQNFKVTHEEVPISKTPIQDENMKSIDGSSDKYIASEREKYIKSIESNPEELKKWETRFGRSWKIQAGKKAGALAFKSKTKNHWDNLEGTFGDKMTWKDNPKITTTVKYVSDNPNEKHVFFIDNNTQRRALFDSLIESGLKQDQIENIASTVTSGGIPGAKMSDRVSNFQHNKNVRGIFIDRQSSSGYNLQAGDTLHVIGDPSNAAEYLQMQGRLARMPRVGGVKVRTYKYSDVPFSDKNWTKLERQMKMVAAVAPSQIV